MREVVRAKGADRREQVRPSKRRRAVRLGHVGDHPCQRVSAGPQARSDAHRLHLQHQSLGKSVESAVKDFGLYALPVLAIAAVAAVLVHRRVAKGHEPS
jgi:hypothetical protein